MVDLIRKIKSIDRNLIRKEIVGASSLSKLEFLRSKYLGKKGEISILLKRLKDLPLNTRKEMGKILNGLGREILELIREREKVIVQREADRHLKKEWIDVTIPNYHSKIERGNLHPITLVLREICELFTSMGFEIVEGPEIENEYYNFEALNIPADHPARDMWDTYYLKNKMLLRTHTSSVQIRYMKKHHPPFRVIAPGRCYRYEAVDATHLDVFNQMEGLVVDKNIRFSDLKGVLQECVRSLLGKDLKTRFRPAYYPFVEPGVDLDVECIFCHGKGCNVCKFSGWIELIPCGMIHPQVLKNVGYDPMKVNGFAFGIGFDRMVMLKYGINDLRFLYYGDLRILKQF